MVHCTCTHYQMIISIQEEGVDLLEVRGSDPIKYAIALMGELFTQEEMGRSCYAGTRNKRPCLPLNKRELLEGALSLSLSLSLSLPLPLPPSLPPSLSFSSPSIHCMLFPLLIHRVYRQEVWCWDSGCLLGCPQEEMQPKMLQRWSQAENAREHGCL